MIDVSREISFKTFRSGGKGGQNVNKVETAAEGSFHVQNSQILSTAQKAILEQKLIHRISSEGYFSVRSQSHRTQLANKDEVIEKMNRLITHALTPKKARIATKPSKQSKENRLTAKKKKSDAKQQRRQTFRREDQ